MFIARHDTTAVQLCQMRDSPDVANASFSSAPQHIMHFQLRYCTVVLQLWCQLHRFPDCKSIVEYVPREFFLELVKHGVVSNKLPLRQPRPFPFHLLLYTNRYSVSPRHHRSNSSARYAIGGQMRKIIVWLNRALEPYRPSDQAFWAIMTMMSGVGCRGNGK